MERTRAQLDGASGGSYSGLDPDMTAPAVRIKDPDPLILRDSTLLHYSMSPTMDRKISKQEPMLQSRWYESDQSEEMGYDLEDYLSRR
jgi:hypothetical protein